MIKRALLVTEYFPPAVGGSARQFDVIVQNARTLRWTVVTQPCSEAPSEEKHGAHDIHRPAWWRVEPSFLKHRTVVVYSRLYRYLDELARRIRPEVIHAMPIYGAGLVAAMIARKHGAPLVSYVYGEELGMQGRTVYRRAVMRRVFRASDGMIAISDRTRTEAIRFGAPPGKIQTLIVFDGKGLAPRNKETARREIGVAADPMLLTVARLAERKGQDQVIRALPELLKDFPSLGYCIVGDGPDRPRLEKLVEDLGVGRHVRFLGLLPDETLAAAYSAADLFVMPNRELLSGEIEGLGLVFLEAGMCGVPSVGGRSGGSATAIVDGETGLLVDPCDLRKFADAVRLLLRDHGLREKMGEAARDYASRIADVPAMIARIESAHLGKS